MSLNGRREGSKIVAASPQRAQEVSGGIKNALDRGESLTKAKQSFINAGYTSQEVQSATQTMRSRPTQVAKLPASPQPNQQIPAQTTSKKTIIILSIIGALILAAALVLGLFWDKIF